MKQLRIDGWIETRQKVFFAYRWVGAKFGETVPLPDGELPGSFDIDAGVATVHVTIDWHVGATGGFMFDREIVPGKLKLRGTAKVLG